MKQNEPAQTQKDPLVQMTPIQKLRAAQALYDTARLLKTAGLKMLHPEWSTISAYFLC